MTQTTKFELTFIGGAIGKFPRYCRMHSTLDSAIATACKVWDKLEDEPSLVGVDPSHVGVSSRVGAHDAVIYGPGLGADGKRVSSYPIPQPQPESGLHGATNRQLTR